MKVLICGGRDWKWSDPIINLLEQLDPDNDIIIHGACRGADMMADVFARQMGFEVRPYPAKWAVYGKGAGPIRNQEMLDKEYPNVVYAFHNNIEESSGTYDMICRADKAGLPYHIISPGSSVD